MHDRDDCEACAKADALDMLHELCEDHDWEVIRLG